MPANLYMALLHYPVYNKNREITATALFNYDLHDMSRVARTYGMRRFFIVQPLEKQLELGRKILHHWIEDWGSTYNPRRKEALGSVALTPTLDDVLVDIESDFGKKPKTVITDAKMFEKSIDYDKMKHLIAHDPDTPYLVIFGTGWGLVESIVDAADYILQPVYGEGSYNHLSVRSAAAIIIDRLCGR